MTFHILTTQRVSCSGQYDRIDDLIAFNLSSDKCPVFRQFLVDEFHLPAVFKSLDPIFLWHVRSPVGEVQGEWLTPCRLLSSLIVKFEVSSRNGMPNASTLFEVLLHYSGRLGHARLCHFLLDAGSRRVAGFSLLFLMQHAPTMTARWKPCSTISHNFEVFGTSGLTPERLHNPKLNHDLHLGGPGDAFPAQDLACSVVLSANQPDGVWNGCTGAPKGRNARAIAVFRFA